MVWSLRQADVAASCFLCAATYEKAIARSTAREVLAAGCANPVVRGDVLAVSRSSLRRTVFGGVGLILRKILLCKLTPPN